MNKTVTKASLAEAINAKLGLNHREAKNLIDIFFETMSEILSSGEELRLSKFGNFLLKDKKERIGRNPKTKEPAIIEARRVIVFHSSEKNKLKSKENIE